MGRIEEVYHTTSDSTPPAIDRGGYGLLSLVWGRLMETGYGPAPIPESPAQSLAALEKLDAAKRKEEKGRTASHH
jgi:hypothetical protein